MSHRLHGSLAAAPGFRLQCSRPHRLFIRSTAIQIRECNFHDVEAISHLVIQSATEHIGPTLSEAGMSRLIEGMSISSQRERIDGEYKYWVAIDDNEYLGTAAIKLPNHLYYLFVKTECHGQGIGKALLQAVCTHVMQTSEAKCMSVNSSLNSVAFYSRRGFVVNGPIKNEHEILFQPMTKPLLRQH